MAIPAVAILGTAAAVNAMASVLAVGTEANYAPWVQSGSAIAAVSALGYVAKQFAAGKLVSRDTAVLEQRLLDLATRQADAMNRSLEMGAQYAVLSKQLYELLVSRLGEH